MKKPYRKYTKKKTFVLTPRVILRATVLLMAGILVILALLTAFNYFALDGPSVEQGSKAGQPLINALEKYKKERGIYPPALSALVPVYLPSLPSAASRYPFTYELCGGASGFQLSFKLGKDALNYCAYSSSATGWTCSSAIFVGCTGQ